MDALFVTPKGKVGDDPDRQTYFNHTLKDASVIDGKSVRLLIDQNLRGARYSDQGRRLVSIPKKLIENMRTLQGLDHGEEFLVSPTLVALADFACSVLLSQEKTLRVSTAKAPRAKRVKAARVE